jgi:hypothetical protein
MLLILDTPEYVDSEKPDGQIRLSPLSSTKFFKNVIFYFIKCG